MERQHDGEQKGFRVDSDVPDLPFPCALSWSVAGLCPSAPMEGMWAKICSLDLDTLWKLACISQCLFKAGAEGVFYVRDGGRDVE